MQQPGEWIFCNRLYRGFSTINWWKAVSENVEVRAPRKNIFIDRLERHGRTLQNRTEVHNVLRKYGFEAVLLDDMSYPEQRELFNNAANVIALHGAGLANIVHCNPHEAGLLEIFTDDLIHPHYHWVSHALGLSYYSAMLGGPLDIQSRYNVDTGLLEDQIKKMLQRDSEQ